MKENIRKLALLNRKFDLSYFYVISCHEIDILLQGFANEEVENVLRRLKFLEKYDKFHKFYRGNINVILT